MTIAEFLKNLRPHTQAMMLPLAATGAAAVPALAELSVGNPTGAAAGGAIALAGFSVLGDTVVNAMGNLLTDRLSRKITDPTELLRNHHLHRLCGESIATLVETIDNVDHRHRDKLAAHLRDEWSTLTEIEGWKQMFDHHSRDGIVDAMKEQGVSWSTATALTQDQWLHTITAVSRRHVPNVAEEDLKTYARILEKSQLTAVRELLKEDAAGERQTFAALELLVHAEQLKLLTDLASGQQQFSQDFKTLQAALDNHQKLFEQAAEDLVNHVTHFIARNKEAFAGLERLLEDWGKAQGNWNDVRERLDRVEESVARLDVNQALHRHENQQADQATHEKLDELAAQAPNVLITNILHGGADAATLSKDQTQIDTSRQAANVLTALVRGTDFDDSGTFVARTQELRVLKRFLLPPRQRKSSRRAAAGTKRNRPVTRKQVVVLNGPTGSGKSRLIDRFVSQDWLAGGYFAKPEAIRLRLQPLEGESEKQKQAILILLASQLRLDMASDSPQQTLAQIGGWLNRPGTLVVIENIDTSTASIAVADVVGGLLQHSKTACFILTSWSETFGAAQKWERLPVANLSNNDCLKLFKSEMSGRRFRDCGKEALLQLSNHLEGLPLAAYLAATYLEARPDARPAEYWKLLQQRKMDLGVKGDPQHRTLHQQFEISLQVLEQELVMQQHDIERLRIGLQDLSHLPPAGTGDDLGATIAGLESTAYTALTHEARDLHLLEVTHEVAPYRSSATNNEPSTRRRVVRLRPLFAKWLRLHVRDNAGQRRMTDWFLRRLPRPLLNDARSQPWIDIHNESSALLHWLQQLPGPDTSLVLRACDEFAGRNGPFPAWIAMCETAAGICATDDDKSARLRVLSWVYLAGGMPDKALEVAKKKLQFEYERDDTTELAEAAVTIGDVHRSQGRLDEAMEVWEQTALPAASTEKQTADIQGRIADILQSRGYLDEALRIHQEEELPVYEKLGDVRERAVTQRKVADILQMKGDAETALQILTQECLPQVEAIGAVRDIAVFHGRIADILQSRGDLDEALRIRQGEQQPVYEKLGDALSLAVTMGKIADILKTRGELDEALRILREDVLSTFEKLNNVRERAVTMGKIADILQLRGESDEALRMFQDDVLSVFEKLSDVRERAVTKGKIADILQLRGESDEALRMFQDDVLPAFEKLGDVRERAVTLGKIADILQSRGEMDEALRMFQDDVLPAFEKLGDVRERAVTMGKIADILQSRGELDEALRVFQDDVLPAFEKLGDVRERAVTMGKIADILQSRGESDEAVRVYRNDVLSVFEKLGDVRERAVTMEKIDDILESRGDLE